MNDLLTRSSNPLCIVGIGASAGGLSALRGFFGALPPTPCIAFVIIQHLNPMHKSYLAELLADATTMPILQVSDEAPVLPGHVYVIPPNTSMHIESGVLHLAPPDEARGHRLPIDHFFRSLAEDQRERAIAIVLSGAGFDGAEGVKSIDANGGMVIVQDPETAEINGMPRSAITTGVANFILPIDKMPQVIVNYAEHPYPGKPVTMLNAQRDEAALDRIYELIRTRTGYNFQGYKPSTLARRIHRRMGLRNIQTVYEYITWLNQHADEIELLFKDLLICVTDFFRDPKAWETLQRDIVIPLVAGKSDSEPIRVWVPACATGEEAFSIAILFLEALQHARKSCPLQVFATDISEAAMQFARLGLYPESIEQRMGVERLAQFFELVPGGIPSYRVKPHLREVVIFGTHNLISDPPFLRMDLISCRNLLIYLEPQVQKNVISVFHFALQPGAYLFLGNAETVGSAEALFKPVSKKWRIYQHQGTSTVARLPMPSSDRPAVSTALLVPPDQRRLGQAIDFAQQILLESFVPAAVMINAQYEIVYYCGPTDRYLLRPRGAPTHDLFLQARQGLRTRLRTVLAQAMSGSSAVVSTDARIKRDGEFKSVKLTVTPIKQFSRASFSTRTQDNGDYGPLFLIVFEDIPRTDPIVGQLITGDPEPAENALLRQMEEDLHATQDDLQRVIEHLEISNEELRASHEEVVSVNQELQSVNEELESSKEELQSMNEELYTVNQQLESKVFELESANDDLNNLLASNDVATLCLTMDMRIKWFSPALQNIFKLVESDLGRPISVFSKLLSGPPLVAEAEAVLKNLSPSYSELSSPDGDWYFRRITPYRTRDNKVVGVIVSYTNITESKRLAEAALQEKQDMAETLERRVLERTAQLRTLTMALSVTEERERRVLAQDLHDDLGQVLALASITLTRIRKANRAVGLKDQLDKVDQLLAQANKSVRSLAFQLCPPVLYELGLVAGLEWLIEEMRERYDLSVTLKDDGEPKPLDTAVCTILFRAVRELLINVAKHAGVKSAAITIKLREGDIEITVSDNGKGFDAETIRAKSQSFGMLSIRERLFYIGGSSRVESVAGRGTRVILTAPLSSALPDKS